MDSIFHDRLDELVEDFRIQLHHQADQVTPSHGGLLLLELERTLFGLLMALGAALVVAFVEAFHRDIPFVRVCQKQARGKGLRNVGWRCTRVYSLFGGCFKLHTPYAVVDRRGQPGRPRARGHRGPTGTGCYPLLEALGCRANATPALLSEVASQVAWGPSEEAAHQRLSQRGISLDNQTLRRFVRVLADEGQARQKEAFLRGEVPPGLKGLNLAGLRVVITFDGGRLRTRVPHRGRRRKSGHHGFARPWRAPRLLVGYTIDRKGRKHRHQVPLYDGVLTSAEQLFERLGHYLRVLNAAEAHQLIFIADGAGEDWQGVAALVEDLGLDPRKVVEVFDWAHAVEPLTTAAEACPLWTQWTAPKRQRWLRKQRKRLKQGHRMALLAAFEQVGQGQDLPDLTREVAFFRKHAVRMRYQAFLHAGIPIGSGAVESALRRVVNLRMKGPGSFWHPENAQRMLYLRCQLLSGRWEAFLQALLGQGTGATPQALAKAA